MPTKEKQTANGKEHKPRRTYTQEEQLAYQNELRTGGRKGCKAPRINLAFAPDVLDYVRIMSRLYDQSITKYIDSVLRSDMEKNAAIYQEAATLAKKASSEVE